jgi:hypothetical protein
MMMTISGSSTPPNSSPSLRPKANPGSQAAGNITPISLASLAQATANLSCSAPEPSSSISTNSSSSGAAGTGAGTGAGAPTPQHRSYARAPQVRPYQSPMMSRGAGGISGQGGRQNTDKAVQGDTKKFGELVVKLIGERSARMSKNQGAEVVQIEDVNAKVFAPAPTPANKNDMRGNSPRTPGRTPAGSLAGSWEKDRVELIVDVPVWTPGCFQGECGVIAAGLGFC